MSNSDFYRIRRLPPYVFAEVNTMKARSRLAGEDIIDLGMGSEGIGHGAPSQQLVFMWQVGQSHLVATGS